MKHINKAAAGRALTGQVAVLRTGATGTKVLYDYWQRHNLHAASAPLGIGLDVLASHRHIRWQVNRQALVSGQGTFSYPRFIGYKEMAALDAAFIAWVGAAQDWLKCTVNFLGHRSTIQSLEALLGHLRLWSPHTRDQRRLRLWAFGMLRTKITDRLLGMELGRISYHILAWVFYESSDEFTVSRARH